MSLPALVKVNSKDKAPAEGTAYTHIENELSVENILKLYKCILTNTLRCVIIIKKELNGV